MGSRGTSNSYDNVVFKPSLNNELITKLNDKNLKLSQNTITIKDENNKTRGMIRSLSKIDKSPKDLMGLHKFKQQTGIDLRQYLGSMYSDRDGQYYIFNKTTGNYVYKDPKFQKMYKKDYDKFTQKQNDLRKLEGLGVTIINYK